MLRTFYAFFRRRWHGGVPIGRLLWRDMLLYGTTLNVVAAFVGLALLAGDASTVLAVAVYFAPVPYNVFLLAALWRSAAAAEEPWASSARVTGVVWFCAMMII